MGMLKDHLMMFNREDSPLKISAGSTIFKQGDDGDLMYLIKSGDVELSHDGASILSLDEGDIFGEMALLDGEVRSATATAKTDCQLYPINKKRFHMLIQQAPYFATEVMHVMAKRIRMLLPRATRVVRKDAKS